MLVTLALGAALASALVAAPAAVRADDGRADDVRAALLTAPQARAATGTTVPLTLTASRCREARGEASCSREWTAPGATEPIPVQVGVYRYRTVAAARAALSDVLADAPPEVVTSTPRRLVAYYSSPRFGIEAYGWQRRGATLVLVGCTGAGQQAEATVACVTDLLAAQVARASTL